MTDEQHPGTGKPGNSEAFDDDVWEVERAVLNDSAEGRTIAADFVSAFGSFMSNDVRPVLRTVAESGGEPQLLVNGLAELLRSTADSIEFPLDHPRAGRPPR